MRIAIERDDGGVSIMVLNADADVDREVAKWQETSPKQKAVSWGVAPSTPNSRAFRDAWVKLGSSISVDMPKARVIKTDRIRVERNERLDAVDKAINLAEDTNDAPEVARLRGARQVLRDLPATIQTDIDVITDPASLDAWNPTWPAGVPR